MIDRVADEIALYDINGARATAEGVVLATACSLSAAATSQAAATSGSAPMPTSSS